MILSMKKHVEKRCCNNRKAGWKENVMENFSKEEWGLFLGAFYAYFNSQQFKLSFCNLFIVLCKEMLIYGGLTPMQNIH